MLTIIHCPFDVLEKFAESWIEKSSPNLNTALLILPGLLPHVADILAIMPECTLHPGVG